MASILFFCHLLQKYELCELISEIAKANLSDQGISMRKRTLLDFNLIPSTL